MVPSRTCAMLVLGFSLALAIVLSFPGELALDGVVPAPTLRQSRAAHLPLGPASIRPDPTTLGVGVEIEPKTAIASGNVAFTKTRYIWTMSLAHLVWISTLVLGALSCAGASPLLPSQDDPNFFSVRICRDRHVLSALKTGAIRTLKADVVIAKGEGSNWTGYRPDNVHLEAISISPDDRNAVFCSVTISAKGVSERIVYAVATTLDSWLVRFGGDLGFATGGHKLFPEGPITVEPNSINQQ
jgi:hypothetical protein